MKIQIFSDLHLEFYDTMPELDYHDEIPDMEADVVIAAGDLGTGTMGAIWLRDRFPKSEVIYIMGNHEYYGSQLPGVRDDIKRCFQKTPRFHLLENESFHLNGWHFFASTLWTDFNLNENPEQAMRNAKSLMNDYRSIKYDDGMLEPIDTMILHHDSRRKLKTFLQKSDPKKSIIITHHSPLFESVEGSRIEALARSAYTSDMIQLIEEYQPAYWIHGHIHKTMEYKIGETTIIQNGLGYPQTANPACNPDFNPEYILEV
jgi:predicted phosphodiesterase